jgi:hypothetical protein
VLAFAAVPNKTLPLSDSLRPEVHSFWLSNCSEGIESVTAYNEDMKLGKVVEEGEALIANCPRY